MTNETARPAWGTWGAILLTVLLFVLRLPGCVQPMGPDQGVYATIGWGLERGLALYRDLWDIKPPAIYLTYAFGFTLFGTRETTIFVMDYLAAIVGIIALFDLCRRAVSFQFAALAAAIFALTTFPAARHAYGGFYTHSITETFIIPLALVAAWSVLVGFSRDQRGWWWWVVSGVLIGLAGIYKPTALIYWPALVVWIWWMDGLSLSRATRFALIAGIGVVMPAAAAIGWLWGHGILEDARIAVIKFPVAYLAVGDSGILHVLNRLAHEVWLRMKTDEVWALGTVAAAIALARYRSWRDTRAGAIAVLGLVWLAAAQIALAANGPRMFVTYFLPSLVPLSLLIAWVIDDIATWPRQRRAVAVVLLAGFTVLMLIRSNSIVHGVQTTAWDLQYMTGQTTREEYLGAFRGSNERAFSASDNEQLAAYVHAHTAPDDRIFVFGMSAATYFSSERLPASRFLFVYPAASHLLDRPEFRLETLAAGLERDRPRYIILQRGNGDSFSGWHAADAFASAPMQELLRAYGKETEIGGFDVYRLRG